MSKHLMIINQAFILGYTTASSISSHILLIPQLRLTDPILCCLWPNKKLEWCMQISSNLWNVPRLRKNCPLLTINCRQLRLWERIRFRHRGTFKQVSKHFHNFKHTGHHDHHRGHHDQLIMMMSIRYTSLDRRREEKSSPPKSPPPFSKAESRFEREQRIKVSLSKVETGTEPENESLVVLLPTFFIFNMLRIA